MMISPWFLFGWKSGSDSGDACARTRHGIELGEALLELAADRLVHAHEQAHHLHDEVRLGVRRPHGLRATAARLEFHGPLADARERLLEVHVVGDEFVRAALSDSHFTGADLGVARPGK